MTCGTITAKPIARLWGETRQAIDLPAWIVKRNVGHVMKTSTTLVACFAFLAIVFAAEREKTRRVVNGKTVDLKPIFEWEDLRSALGARSKSLPPRPMPHWERIAAEIFEDGNPNGIVVRRNSFIVIKNLPPPRRNRGIWKKGQTVRCLAVGTGLTNYVTAQKIPALVYDHGREID